jgi:O-antigen/teichoic acid export membrane protein
VHYLLGEKWEIAIGLLQVFGVVCALKQIAFNWTGYHRAVGDTRPIAVNGFVGLIAFVIVLIPGMILWGLDGYAAAICAMIGVQLLVRWYYLARLFEGFKFLRHSLRAIAPSIPAVAAVLGVRLLEGGGRPASIVLGELALYVAVTVGATCLLERALLVEMFGYLRRARTATQPRPSTP